MASHAVTGAVVPPGVNETNLLIVKAVTTDALANTNTFDVVVPSAGDSSGVMVPVGWKMYTLAGGVYTRVDETDIQLTTHTVATRTTRFTAADNIAAGAILLVQYGLAA